jgi:hypothetical protein
MADVWTTPITVASTEVVPENYFDIVRNDIAVLGKGGGKGTPEDATSASTLTLPNETDDFFNVTGDANISYIGTSGRLAGNRMSLVFNDVLQIYNESPSPPTGYAKVKIYNINGSIFATKTVFPDIEYKFLLVPDGASLKWLISV